MIVHTDKRLEMALAWAKIKIGGIAGHLKFPKEETYISLATYYNHRI